ncbi:la protein homolog [Uloborus diversus]|uniref:la protein homolog n=1 Tax=Uloborus diversus TaxID=327109 RepID=UPI00240A1D5A|nr:la protein homolog [Uloborus diversus]
MGEENTCANEEGKEISDLEAKIIRQVEYYFGNYNLARDKFLGELVKQDDGWVPMETMIKFKRLKSLSEDFEVITTALKKSPNQLLEVSEDGSKIRRMLEKPLPANDEEHRRERDERTLYVKGFKRTTTLDELLEYFKPHNSENILMRRNPANKTFKGSVFVTFETKDDSVKFLENKSLKFEGMELLRETKKAYIERKDIFFENLRKEKEKKLLGKKDTENKNEENVAAPQLEMKEGCCLKLTGLDNNVTREMLKDTFGSYGNIIYIDYSRGKQNGIIRFEEGIVPDIVQKIPEEDGQRKVKIGSSNPVVTLIEGDEEKEYWNTIAISRANTFALKKAARGQHRGQKQGGNKGWFKKNWNKRKGANANDENNASDQNKKKAKLDDGAENASEEPPKKKVKSDLESGTKVETAVES